MSELQRLQKLLADKRAKLASMRQPRPVIGRGYPVYALVKVGAYEQPMLRRAG